jgi:transposase
MNIRTLGIDLAKNIFQIHGVDSAGKKLVNKSIRRNKLPEFIHQLPPCLIGMEACGGSNYWGQKFTDMGHEVKLISPQFVKPYVKSNKNDAVDAEAICEAVTRPNMRFVAIKNKEQQDVQCIHKVRARLVREKTALANQIRGLLHEYGIIIPLGISYVMSELPLILEDGSNGLTLYGRDLFNDGSRLVSFSFLKKYCL